MSGYAKKERGKRLGEKCPGEMSYTPGGHRQRLQCKSTHWCVNAIGEWWPQTANNRLHVSSLCNLHKLQRMYRQSV